MVEACFERLDSLAGRGKYEKPLLSNRNSREELDKLKRDFVITVVDKVAGNFAFTCKKFYFLRLAEELGLNNNIPGNETYTGVAELEAEVCDKIK